MAGVYLLSLGTGIFLAHTGNQFTLNYRDRLVARANRSDPASRADDAGAHGKAAIIDFTRNLGLAAIPDTIGGLTIVLPVATATYRGWVGGIVSVGRTHHSRLAHPKSAIYYLVTLAFQLSAFILAGATGLRLGWDFVRKQGPFCGPNWCRLPKPALIDAGWVYLLITPLFALGSIWEFFAPVH